MSFSTDRQPAEDRQSHNYLQIRAAQLEDVSAIAEILADSFHAKDGWLGWAYPLLRLGIAAAFRQPRSDQSRGSFDAGPFARGDNPA